MTLRRVDSPLTPQERLHIIHASINHIRDSLASLTGLTLTSRYAADLGDVLESISDLACGADTPEFRSLRVPAARVGLRIVE